MYLDIETLVNILIEPCRKVETIYQSLTTILVISQIQVLEMN